MNKFFLLIVLSLGFSACSNDEPEVNDSLLINAKVTSKTSEPEDYTFKTSLANFELGNNCNMENLADINFKAGRLVDEFNNAVAKGEISAIEAEGMQSFRIATELRPLIRKILSFDQKSGEYFHSKKDLEQYQSKVSDTVALCREADVLMGEL